MESQTDCNICCEKMNKSSRKKVECLYCQFICCRNCMKRHIMSGSENPFCMNPECKKIWTQDFVKDNMTKVSYEKEYTPYLLEIKLEQQKSLLPATQHLVQEEKQKRLYIAELRLLEEERNELVSKLKIIKERVYILQDRIRYGYDEDGNGNGEYKQGEEKEEKEESKRRERFFKACPREDCRGFLSTSWKCGICDEYTCSKCHEPKNGKNDENHECNEDSIKTVKLLSGDTKPCPSCATPIHKIEGCDQMLCVQCGTAFSWRRGTIETGVIHNPHYFEWLKQKGKNIPRNPRDIPCGGVINGWEEMRFGRYWGPIHRQNALKNYDNVYQYFINSSRICSHIQEVTLEQFEVVEPGQDLDSDLRVKYLMNEIDEISWKKTLKMRLKKRQKNKEVNEIYRTLIILASEIHREIINSREYSKVLECIEELEQIREFTNKSLRQLSRKYKNKIPIITSQWWDVMNQK